MQEFRAYLSSNACYYDAITNSWFRIKKISIIDGLFSDIHSEVCNPDDEEFDLFILPGFIDAHCHLLESPYYAESSDQIDKVGIDVLIDRANININTAGKAGITALKDMGGRAYSSIDVIKQLQSKLPVRLYTTGCYFTSPGGHGSDRGAVIIDNISTFIDALELLIKHDIKYCKILHDDTGFDKNLLNKMIVQAHNRGMLVSCHAYTEKAASEAVSAGTNILEHAGDYSESLLKTIKDKDVIIVPTFVGAYDSTPDNCKILSDVDASTIKKWLDGERVVIPKLFQKGIMVALGTDSGFPGTPFDSLFREIMLLHHEFRITIEQLLFSAFIITPKTISMDRKLGRIAKNYFADFLCYYKNPLSDIKTLRFPNEVWIDGRRVDNVDIKSILTRRLNHCDVKDIMACLHNYYFDCSNLNDFWTIKEIEAWISNDYDYCIGAFLRGDLVGFCLTHYHSDIRKVHIENIFVVESYRKQGIAQLLLSEILSFYIKQSDYVRFIGLVNCGNNPPLKLLEKNDFMKGHPMFWMQRNIIDQ